MDGRKLPAGVVMFQLYDEKRQKRYPLTGLLKEIGRTSECDVCVPDDERVSRQHARLEWDGTAWVVVDLGSTNGTFVNGERVTERKLEPGDVLEIGDVQLRYLPLPLGGKVGMKKTTQVSKGPGKAPSGKQADATRPIVPGKGRRPDQE